MSTVFGAPVNAAYHIVLAVATALSPLLGGLAAAGAIILFTAAVRLLLVPLSYRAMKGMDAQARLAPQVQALRKQHADRPEEFQRALAALYRSAGTSVYSGCLPILVQWPFFSVMYLVFRSPMIRGARNVLLTHHLLGVPLAGHWLTGAGPLSAHGAVFAGLFLLLAVVGRLTARFSRGLAAPEAGSATASGQAPAIVARIAPYLTVAIAAFLPLASGLYLATTATWTLGERAIMRRLRNRSVGGTASAAKA
jgi:YidC/Oxa1 family membrane protein insertase